MLGCPVQQGVCLEVQGIGIVAWLAVDHVKFSRHDQVGTISQKYPRRPVCSCFPGGNGSGFGVELNGIGTWETAYCGEFPSGQQGVADRSKGINLLIESRISREQKVSGGEQRCILPGLGPHSVKQPHDPQLAVRGPFQVICPGHKSSEVFVKVQQPPVRKVQLKNG